jgi:ABC-type transport system involved in multi-copper enzyme maturation permease subunit
MSGTAPKAKIYDLGYKRYLGTRRAQSTRWQVITRDQIAQAWRKWWRWKLWLGFSLLTTAVVAGILVFTKTGRVGELTMGGEFVQVVDELVVLSVRYYTFWCFLTTLTVGCGVIANDLRSGAFTFYFARPVRPLDYVLGKLIALFLVQAAVMLVPMVVLSLVRVGLSKHVDEAVHNLRYIPKALLIGSLGSLAYASLSLALSSMFPKPWLNIAVWCGFYFVGSSMIAGIGQATHHEDLGVVDPVFALQSLAFRIHGIDGTINGREVGSMLAACIGLAVMIIGGIAFSYWRVKGAAHKGIGGGS